MARLQEDLVPEVVLEDAAQDVHGEVGACVPHVACVVHRRPARVPGHLVRGRGRGRVRGRGRGGGRGGVGAHAHLVAFFGHEELFLARE